MGLRNLLALLAACLAVFASSNGTNVGEGSLPIDQEDKISRDASECLEIIFPSPPGGLIEDDESDYDETLNKAVQDCIRCCTKHKYPDYINSSGQCACVDLIPPPDTPIDYVSHKR